MNKRQPYSSIIERKLEQLPAVDADQLWNDMHSILDKKMPQKKERRRFILWFLMSKPFLLLTAGFIIGTGTTVFFLSTNKNSTAIVTKLPESQHADKINENNLTKAIEVDKQNITPTVETDLINKKDILTITSSANKTKRVVNKNFITGKINTQLKNYTETAEQLKNQFTEATQSISNARPDFDIATVNLNSGYQDLFNTKNSIKERNSLNIQVEALSNNSKKDPSINNDKGLYAGIMSGIDLSSTNFKSVKTGSTKGFILGYAFNKRWSIESGLLWDTKRVYDNGTNFNPPGYTPSSSFTIMNVNGKSRLYEIPLNLKYNIIRGGHNFFATTGLSSYIMRTENYDYEYMQNGQPIGHNYLRYKNETRNWFSVANFSLGYTHRFGALGGLRVEPYLKLPLRNIGVGKMPIMSTGLNIGFTKQIR